MKIRVFSEILGKCSTSLELFTNEQNNLTVNLISFLHSIYTHTVCLYKHRGVKLTIIFPDVKLKTWSKINVVLVCTSERSGQVCVLARERHKREFSNWRIFLLSAGGSQVSEKHALCQETQQERIEEDRQATSSEINRCEWFVCTDVVYTINNKTLESGAWI